MIVAAHAVAIDQVVIQAVQLLVTLTHSVSTTTQQPTMGKPTNNIQVSLSLLHDTTDYQV